MTVRWKAEQGRNAMSLYDPKLERDNCGFGLLAHMEGKPATSLSVSRCQPWLACSTAAASPPMARLATAAACCCKTRQLLQSRRRREGMAPGPQLRGRHAVPEPGPRPGPGHARHHRRGTGKRDPESGRLAQGAHRYQCTRHRQGLLPSIEQVFVNAPGLGRQDPSAASI